MLPLIAQRDQQLHEAVLALMHLALPMLEQALPLPVQALMVLLQLHERLVVSGLQTQQLESMSELEPLPPEDLRFLRTQPAQPQELKPPSFVLVENLLVVQLVQLALLVRLHQALKYLVELKVLAQVELMVDLEPLPSKC
jgi:hypothetical protein